MKAFKDYDTTRTIQDRPTLPAGGYVAVIKAAQERTYTSRDGGSFSKLEIAFDISEGEYKGFFTADLDAQTGEDKKWKGVLRQYIPSDDGSERDAKTKMFFKTMIEAIEDSNPGYHWDWDEKKLKGKTVGVIFRNEEWDYQGKQGWKAQPFKFIEAEKIRQGKFTVPKDKPLSGSSSSVSSAPSTAPASDFEEIDDDDLPF